LVITALAAAALATLAGPARALTYNFASGDYIAGLTSPNPLGAADTLAIVGGGNKFFSAVNFSNLGTVNWGDSFYMQSGAFIDNAGLWLAGGDDSIVYNGGATAVFNNSGTFRKSGGVGTSSIGSIAFVNSGVIDTETGTLALSGGNVTINAGSQFTGAGVTVVGNNASFNGGFLSQNLVLAGGTFSGDAAVVSGNVSFSGGYLSGSWAVAAGQQLSGVDGGNKFISAGTLTNQGTVAWNTGDTLYLQSGGTLLNQGRFAVNSSATLAYNGGAQSTFNNSGLIDVAAGRTLTVASVHFVNDGGMLDASGSIEFNGGDATFNSGSAFVGSGVTRINSNAVFVGAFNAQNLVLAAGNFNGGNGDAGSKAVANGNLAFTGGAFTGQWQLAAGQTLVAGNGGNKHLVGAAFENLGSIEWATADALYLQSGAVLDNRGSFRATESSQLIYNGGATPQFNNLGQFGAAAGKTLVVGSVAFVNLAGGQVQTEGTVAFNGGNARFENGSLFGGGGTVQINSNATFAGGYSGSNLFFNGGVFTGSDAVVNGLSTFTGGTFSGSWQVAPGQTLAAADGGNKFVTGGTLDNRGTLSWNSSNPLYLQSSGVVDNRGLFVATVSTSMEYNGGAATQFNNHGVLRADAGVALHVGSVGYVNKAGGVVEAVGSVNFNGSGAQFEDGSVFSGSGRVNINNNTSFSGGYSGSNLYINAGTASGNGAVVNGTTHFTGGTLAGSWAVAAGQQVLVEAGGSKVLIGAQLANAGILAMQDNQALYLQSGAQLGNSGRIDFRGDGGIFYNGGAATALLNTGLIVKTAGSGASVISDGTGLVNQGVIEVQAGTIQLPGNFSNDGVLKGVGTFSVPGTLTNAGHMAPGGSPGTLTLAGDYAQTAAGFFDVDVTSAGVHDLFNVSGAVLLDGSLTVQCQGDCSMPAGTEFVVLDYNGTRSGSFASLTLAGFASGSFQALYDDANSQVLLRVIEATAPVPEPETWALLLGGLGIVSALARRRQRM
jgi:hypothetical protein